MRIFSLCLILLFIPGVANAQNKVKIDSLLKKLKTTTSDTQKIKIYNRIGWHSIPDSAQTFYYSHLAFDLAKKINYNKGIVDSYYQTGWVNCHKGHYAQATELLMKALKLSQDIVYKKGEAYAYNGLGTIHDIQGNYPLALKYYKRSVEINENNHNTKGTANGLNNIGNVYFAQGNYPQALEYYKKTLKIDQKQGNKTGMAFDYNNLGNIHSMQGNYALALKYYQRSLKIEQEYKNQDGIAGCYENMGMVYQAQGNTLQAIEYHQKALKIQLGLNNTRRIASNYNNLGAIYLRLDNYPQALEYYQQSFKIDQKLNNKKGVAINYNNIGNVYMQMHKYGLAMQHFQQSLKIFKNIGDQSGIGNCLYSLGKLALANKQYTKAQQNFELTLSIQKQLGEKDRVATTLVALGKTHYLQKNYAKAIQLLDEGVQKAKKTGNPGILKDGAETLAKTHRAKGNLLAAYNNYVLFKQMSDSLVNEENTKKITRLETRYEFQQEKDSLHKASVLQASQLKQEQLTNKFQHNINLLILAILAIVVIFAFITYRNQQRQKRLNIQLNDQKKDLETQGMALSTLNEELKQSQEEITAQRDAAEQQNQKLSFHRERIDQSFRAAQMIQDAILPPHRAIANVFVEHFILYIPKDVVSGDFYWIHQHPEKTILVIADCTGHGVPGAFMTLIGNKLLDKIIKIDQITDPGTILNRLHEDIQVTLRQKETQRNEAGMDAITITITKANKDGQANIGFAGAKNSLIYFDKQTQQLAELKGTRKSLGGMQSERRQFESQYINLPKGSLLYSGSDGLTDQGDTEGVKFGKKRLHDFLEHHWRLPLNTQKEKLEQVLNQYKFEAEQRDDILWMGFKI